MPLTRCRTGVPLYRDRECGIDTGKAQMVATIRAPSDKAAIRSARPGMDR
ncbi:MAG TPA: hypothetical protein VIV12_26005 [Streptosporangiaceae bacterium]